MTFKGRYDTEPEFRKKHLEYMKTKVSCPCGAQVSRSNMSTHRKKNVKHQEYENMLKESLDQEVKQSLKDITKLLMSDQKLVKKLISKKLREK